MLRYVWLTGPLYKSFCFTNERECFCKHLHCFAYAKNERSVRYVRLAYVWLIIQRENVFVSIYIALHMLDNEHTIRKVTLPLVNWSIIQIVLFY